MSSNTLSKPLATLRGKQVDSNIRKQVSIFLRGYEIDQFNQLWDHPVFILREDRKASPSLIIRRALQVYEQHIGSLNKSADSDKEQVALLRLLWQPLSGVDQYREMVLTVRLMGVIEKDKAII